MELRLKKQLVIILVLLLIFSGIGFLIYFNNIRHIPSCSDGIKNQGEEDIDCGGPCLPCEFVYIKDIEVLWTENFCSGDGFCDVAAKIKNPNQNYGSVKVPYYFKLYDSNDNLAAEYSGDTYIFPNQTKHIIQPRIKASGNISRTEFSLGEINWQEAADLPSLQLAILQKEYKQFSAEENIFSQLKAVLVNKTNFDFDKIDIDILLYDANHKLLNIGHTELYTFLTRQEREFIFNWFKEFEGQVALLEIEPETNLFNPENYLSILPDEIERFQSY
jgi:hypothetical protein